MDMREILKNILEKYPNAQATASYVGQHEIRSLFESLKESIRSLGQLFELKGNGPMRSTRTMRLVQFKFLSATVCDHPTYEYPLL